MNKLIFTCVAAALVTAPMATVVKAEETTIIKRDSDRDREVIKEREGGERTVIKKEEELKVLRGAGNSPSDLSNALPPSLVPRNPIAN